MTFVEFKSRLYFSLRRTFRVFSVKMLITEGPRTTIFHISSD